MLYHRPTAYKGSFNVDGAFAAGDAGYYSTLTSSITAGELVAPRSILGTSGTVTNHGALDVTQTFQAGLYSSVTNAAAVRGDLAAASTLLGTSGAIAACADESTVNADCIAPYKGTLDVDDAFGSGDRGYYAAATTSVTAGQLLNTETILGTSGTIVNRGTLNLRTGTFSSGLYSGVSQASAVRDDLAASQKLLNVSGDIKDCANESTLNADCIAPYKGTLNVDGSFGSGDRGYYAAASTSITAGQLLNTRSILGTSGTIANRGTLNLRTGTFSSGLYSGVSQASAVRDDLSASQKLLNVSGDLEACADESTTNASCIAAYKGDFDLENSFAAEGGAGYYRSVSNSPSSALVVDGAIILGVAGTGTVPAVSGFTANAGLESVQLSWQSDGQSGFVLVYKVGSAVDWEPQRGQTYFDGEQASSGNYFLDLNTATSHNLTGLTGGSTYYFELYGHDGSNSYSTPVKLSATPSALDCAGMSVGGSWVKVPADGIYVSEEYCVQKYEARSGAISQASGTPQVEITQTAARSACTALGGGFDLISNDQWMNLATNIAQQPNNWTGSLVGTGKIFRGHSDAGPNYRCSNAGGSETLSAVSGSCSHYAPSAGDDQRRFLYISNGNVIWDLSGNVNEWTTRYEPSGKNPGTLGRHQYTDVNFADGTNWLMRDLVPQTSEFPFWDDSWDTGVGIGNFESGGQNSGGALRRGGRQNAHGTVAPGIFTAIFSSEPTLSNTQTGYRCVFTTP